MKNHEKILGVILALLLALSVVPLTASATQSSAHTADDIRTVEFVAARDIYAGFDNAETGIAANVTFKNGDTFVYDFGYGYDAHYSQQQEDFNYETAQNLSSLFTKDFSFSAEAGDATMDEVKIGVTANKDLSFTFNREITLKMVENPVMSISVVGESPALSANAAQEMTHSYRDENTGRTVTRTYRGFSVYEPEDIKIHYTDGTDASLLCLMELSGFSRSDFDGTSYSDYLNYDLPFEGAEAYGNDRQRVEFISNQAQTPWTAGNKYPVTVRYMGCQTTYYVSITNDAAPTEPSTESTPDEADFSYGILDDTAVILRYSGEAAEVTIPSTLGGYRVTAIDNGAFSYHRKLSAVHIPDTVTEIGETAFAECASLKNVTIPKSVTTIGEKAFGYYVSNWSYVKYDDFTISGYEGSEAQRYAEDNGFTFIKLDVTSGSLSGSIKSFLSETDEITVNLTGGGLNKTVIVSGRDSVYAFKSVPVGTYTLSVSKANHVTRTSEVKVSGDATQDVKICPIGDVTQDGKITTMDFTKANSHARSVNLMSGYELLCGDVVKQDGLITTLDATRINSHAKGINKMW